MERLSGLDAMYLYLETPSAPLNVCCVVEVDVTAMPGGYSFDTLRSELGSRLLAVPEFCKKLAGGQLNIDHPVWVECAGVDLSRHLKRIAVPAPGGRAEVAEICAHVAALPLDRGHPLWEVWAMENSATPELLTLIVKAHHSLVDGVGGANIMTQLCSLEPDLPAPRDPVTPAPAANRLQIAATGVLGFAFWTAAARGYDAAEVGRASAILSSATLIAILANFSLGNLYERFLPLAGRDTHRLVRHGTTFALGAAVLFGVVFVLVGPRDELFPHPVEMALFPVAVAVLSVYALQDQVLVGLGRARMIATKNIGQSTTKLVAVIALIP